jgi:hypothetical protein
VISAVPARGLGPKNDWLPLSLPALLGSPKGRLWARKTVVASRFRRPISHAVAWPSSPMKLSLTKYQLLRRLTAVNQTYCKVSLCCAFQTLEALTRCQCLTMCGEATDAAINTVHNRPNAVHNQLPHPVDNDAYQVCSTTNTDLANSAGVGARPSPFREGSMMHVTCVFGG